ncbi:MAG: preprotein translocase subunit SecE [Burkholderiaceae bacterium]|nr:MAG: preprotein translocase subunit SecE [Burkholderiaceae bacterium]
MASTQPVDTVNTTADKAKLGAAAVLVVLALVAYYLLGKQGPVVQWAGLLVGVAAGVAVFFTAEPGKQLIAFGRDAWREVGKVVWPTRKESLQITAYVFGFVLLMAIFLWLTDKTLEWVFYDLILGWKK